MHFKFDQQFFTGLRDETIRELFKTYPPLKQRKIDPYNYDDVINKILLRILHSFDDKLNRCYAFLVKSKFSRYSRLARINRYEGCQLLVLKTNKFVQVPFEIDNLTVKTISRTLSQGLRFYKLKIEFCDQFGNRAGETLIFDPILNLQLYNWWDENFENFMKLFER